jgi:hypothetical protein
MKPNRLITSLLFLILSITPPLCSLELVQQDRDFMEKFLTNFAVDAISTAIHPMIAVYFENLLKEFQIDPNIEYPKRINSNNYRIPQSDRNNPQNTKNPGMFLAITTDTLNKNIHNLMPRFLNVMKKTEIPFIYQVGPLLIKSLKMTIPEGQDPRAIKLIAEPQSNSLIVDITNLHLNIKKKIFFSLLIQKFEGFVNVKTTIKKLKLQITFLKDKDKYYSRPIVYCYVREINIDDDNLLVTSQINNLPNGFTYLIASIFKTQIKDTIEMYLKNTMHKDTTTQINALIQKFYRDSIDIDEKMAINVLMTDKIIVEEGQIQIRIAGEFFDFTKPYTIKENDEDILGFEKDNPGIQFGLSKLSMESFFHVFFSNPKNYFIKNKYNGMEINARLSFDKMEVEMNQHAIAIRKVEIGVFCESPDNWACLEIMGIDLMFKINLFDPNNGIIYMGGVLPQVTKSELVRDLGGKFKEAIYSMVVNEFLKSLPLQTIHINPLPIPKFLHLNNLLFTHLNGFAFMETNFELTDLQFI